MQGMRLDETYSNVRDRGTLLLKDEIANILFVYMCSKHKRQAYREKKEAIGKDYMNGRK